MSIEREEREKRGWGLHFAFFTRATRLALASVEMDLCAPLPDRIFEIWIMRGVGITSWFLLPIST